MRLAIRLTYGSIPSLSGRGIQFLLLVLTGAAGTAALRALSPMQEAVRIALSLSDNQMALLQGPALALPVVLAGIPLGLLVDRHSRVRILLILTALETVGCLLTALGSSFALLFVARSLVGLATAGMTIAIYSVLADLYPPAQRGRAKAIVVIGQYGGTSLAFALGGALIAVFGGARGWHWAMFWLTCPMFGLVTLMVLWIREPPRLHAAHESSVSLAATFAQLRRHRRTVFLLIVGVALAEMPVFAVLTWAAPAMMRTYGLTAQKVGAIMSTVTILSGLIGPLLGGSLADLCQRTGGPGRTVVMLSALVALSAAGALFPLLQGVSAASVLLAAFLILAQAGASMGVTLFIVVVPNELRGLCLALLSAAVSLFTIALAPLAISALSGAIGGPAMIGKAMALVCMTASMLCAVTFAMGARHISNTGVIRP
jgi:predicted MFS family arabinose efflux permease